MPFESQAAEAHSRVTVPSKENLSRHVAALVVKMAVDFKSDILFSAGAIHINAKSTLMAFTLLVALKGHTMELSARGTDAALAVRKLAALFRRINIRALTAADHVGAGMPA